MRAAVLQAPGPPQALTIQEIPIPVPAVGWVLIKVRAFGLNRSELHTRLGLAEGVIFPRVLGIEATGVVAECPGGEFEPGQRVVALMGGMGRTFDGGYAENTCVPVSQVVAFESDLDWATLGAIPEMLQTSPGSLTIGLDAKPGQSLLIRGHIFGGNGYSRSGQTPPYDSPRHNPQYQEDSCFAPDRGGPRAHR
jgi:NADPH2:quinone reductase